MGSIVAISNQAGDVVEKRYFDAWGSLKNLEQNGVVVNINADNIYDLNLILDRGYTGHEHLLKAGLIHMNGRLYDPLMHRFLQPDNYVQDPSNTQNYNRYGYVLNNPLKYTDPSGEEFITAFIIAVVVSSFMYVSNELSAGRPVTLKGFTRNLFITAFSSAVTFGIGSGVSAISSNFFVQTAVAAVAHGAFQGGMSALFGGNFWSGFASGSISSVAASLWKGGGEKNNYSFKDGNGNFAFGRTVSKAHQGISGYLGATGGAGTVLFGAIAGGAGASMSGGNFWQGAVTGGIVAGLNHLMHDGDNDNGDPKKTKPKYTYRDYKLDANGNIISEKLVYFKSSGKDSLLYQQAVSEPLIDGTLSVYGHGNTHNFTGYNYVGDVDAIFLNDSIMYQNSVTNRSNLTMVLKSCYTGNTEGGYTISENLTQMRSNLIIHAPISYWKYDGTLGGNAGYNQFINGVKTGWDLKK